MGVVRERVCGCAWVPDAGMILCLVVLISSMRIKFVCQLSD